MRGEWAVGGRARRATAIRAAATGTAAANAAAARAAAAIAAAARAAAIRAAAAKASAAWTARAAAGGKIYHLPRTIEIYLQKKKNYEEAPQSLPR